MTSDEREKFIIEFIKDHDRCSPEEAFDGVKQKMSRQSFFKSLAELKICKIISEENLNKRDKSLQVKNDFIVKVMIELDYCKTAYFAFLKKVLIEIRKPISRTEEGRRDLERKIAKYNQKPPETPYNLLFEALTHFRIMINYYNYSLSIVWPFSNYDKKYLEKLQSYVLRGIWNMYSELYKTLRTERIHTFVESIPGLDGNLDQIMSRTMKGSFDVFTEQDKIFFERRYGPLGLGKYAAELFSSRPFSNRS